MNIDESFWRLIVVVLTYNELIVMRILTVLTMVLTKHERKISGPHRVGEGE